jgi:hypothetical protein
VTAYEAGTLPAGGGKGGMIIPRRTQAMQLQVLQSLIADGADQQVQIKKGYCLLIHSIGASCTLRASDGAADSFTIPADSPTPLGEALQDYTVYLRATAGTVIDLALI